MNSARVETSGSTPAVNAAHEVHVRRFDDRTRHLHIVVMTTFLGLSLTGIPLLFRTAYEYGVKKNRCRVHLVGGAEIATAPKTEASVGKRNVLAARALLWKNGVLVEKEVVGGSDARNVQVDVRDGSVQLTSARGVAARL